MVPGVLQVVTGPTASNVDRHAARHHRPHRSPTSRSSCSQMASPDCVVPFALWPLGASAASNGQVELPVLAAPHVRLPARRLRPPAFNMFALYMFGGALEQVVGPRRFTAYYLVSVLAAGADAARRDGAGQRDLSDRRRVGRRVRPAARVRDLLPATSCSSCSCRSRSRRACSSSSTRRSSCSSASPAPQEGVAHFAHLGGLVGGGADARVLAARTAAALVAAL